MTKRFSERTFMRGGQPYQAVQWEQTIESYNDIKEFLGNGRLAWSLSGTLYLEKLRNFANNGDWIVKLSDKQYSIFDDEAFKKEFKSVIQDSVTE